MLAWLHDNLNFSDTRLTLVFAFVTQLSARVSTYKISSTRFNTLRIDMPSRILISPLNGMAKGLTSMSALQSQPA